MAKVKLCLDSGCTKYILLDDGRTVHTPKEKCTPKVWNADERSKFEDIVRETRETIMTSKPVMQKVKEGDEVNL